MRAAFGVRGLASALPLTTVLALPPIPSLAAHPRSAASTPNDVTIVDYTAGDAGRPSVAPHALDLHRTYYRLGPATTVDVRL